MVERLKIELRDLSDKVDNLSIFVNIDKFETIPQIQQDLLKIQLSCMKGYEEVLKQRLSHIAKTKNIN